MVTASLINVSLYLILFGILGMFLLAVAIIVFFIQYQRKLYAQQEELRLMETNYQRDLLNASLEAQEVERKRVASDLHDGVGSLLSAAKLYLRQLSPRKAHPKREEMLTEATQIVDTAIEQTRSISHNLMPSTLDRFGVFVALEELCKRIRNANTLAIELSYPDHSPTWPPKQHLAVYRIVQELINNTLKHADANRISIDFTVEDQHIKLTYQDDGKGFLLEDKPPQELGLGLKSIKSRVQQIDSEMKMASTPGAGFHFEMQLLNDPPAS